MISAIQGSNAALPAASAATGWERWLGGYSPATQAAYRRDAEEWFSFCRARSVDPLRASKGDVTAWIDELRTAGRRDATVARKIATLGSLYSWARDEGITDVDPLPRRRPKVHLDDRQLVGLDPNTARLLLRSAEAWGPREHALVALLITCGLRISEALGANVSDLADIRGHRVLSVMGKGSRPRSIALPPRTWHAIAAYLAERAEGPLFVTSTGARWDRIAAGRSLDRVAQRAGLDHVSPHQLRHTAASLALDAGAPLDRVQALLGHADPRTTMKYAAARERLDTSAAYDVARLLADGE